MKALLLLALFPLASIAAEAPPAPTPQEPLRHAKVHGKIQKWVVTDGSYAPAELVCDFNAEVPVYAPMEKGMSQAMPSAALCQTTVGGKAMRVQLMAAVSLVEPRDGEPAKKHLQAIFFVFRGGKTPGNYLSQTGGAATDPDARLMSLSLFGTSYENVGLPKKFEVFSANLNVVDDQN